jgi:hypothetical protein
MQIGTIVRHVLMALLTLFTMTIVYELPFILNVFATSPSFPLQGVYNNQNDWSLEKAPGFEGAENIAECTVGQQHRFLSPHIAAVSYISDGRTLNATLWLSSAFKEPTISSSSLFKEVERTYALLIHSDSTYDTGQNYQVVIQWNPLVKTWSKIIKESSPPFIFQSEKVLDQVNNYTGFFVKGKNYVDLSLNLSIAGSPSQYRIISYASDTFMTKDSHVCHLIDVTDVVHVPPPEFIISTLPNSVSLFPGENKTIELQIKSNTNLDSHILLYPSNQTDSIKLTFTPREISIPPSGLATSLLHIKASESATVHPYTIPIFAKISFPTTISNWLSGDILYKPASATINKASNFTATIQEPLTPSQQIRNIWESWGLPISGFVALITALGGGGIVGWFLKTLKSKRSKQDKYRKQNEGWQ